MREQTSSEAMTMFGVGLAVVALAGSVFGFPDQAWFFWLFGLLTTLFMILWFYWMGRYLVKKVVRFVADVRRQRKS